MIERVLAQQVDPDMVSPGVLGFLVIVAIGLATWVLLRSLNHQLKKVDFDETPRPGEPGDGDPPGPSSSA